MTQQPTSPTLSQELKLHCVDPRGRTVELVARFSYDRHDAYAVAVTFASRSGDVCWLFCREVLRLGLTTPAGGGDLRMWPSIDEVGRAVLVMAFHSPDGRLVAQANAHEVHHFLARTLALVPAGTEGGHLDLDGLVDALLGRSPSQ